MVQAIKKEWQEESVCLLTGINAFRKGGGGARSIKLRNRQGRRLVRMVYKTIVYIRNP